MESGFAGVFIAVALYAVGWTVFVMVV